jgi:molybdenum cofactor synthesis domain-containing protein
MRPLKRLISLDDAMSLTIKNCKHVVRAEKVRILEANGRVSAEKVVSDLSVPPFSRSAMDGYAVRAKDTFGASKLRPVRLRMREAIFAGGVPKQPVGKGECSEIATGAMLPKGADATVMVENTESDSGTILVYESVHPGQNVSGKGEDISPGTVVVSKGDVLNPSRIGALAAIGRGEIRVFSKPLVCVVPTGNEIRELGGPLSPGQVYNINSYTLTTVLTSCGAEVRTLPVVGDTVSELERVLKDNGDCDIVVFSGGSSVGERDMMLDVVSRMGTVVFHGVAMKPGKPTLFGMVGRQMVFGMPGYPTACLSNAYVLLSPVVRRMARLPERLPETEDARMASRVVSTTGRAQFLTVRLRDGVAFSAFKESGAITSMAFADGYVLIPSDVDLIEKGEAVTVHRF